MVQKNGLETILNVKLPDTQWKQATLPVHMGGLGSEERMHAGTFSLSGFSCSHAAPSRSHPVHLSRRSRRYRCVQHQTYVELSGQHDRPSDLSKHIQRAWDAPVTTAAYNVVMSTLSITGGSSKA